MPSSVDILPALVLKHNHEIQSSLKAYSEENSVYLSRYIDYQEAIKDHLRLGNELVMLTEKGILYVGSEQKYQFDEGVCHQADTFIAKNADGFLIATTSPSCLILFNVDSKEFIEVNISGLLENEKPSSGLINNSNKDKLNIWVGTTLGRVIAIEKTYLKSRQKICFELKQRTIESISLDFNRFTFLITDKEILVLRENLVPHLKISKDSSDGYISTVKHKPNALMIVFQRSLIYIEHLEGNITYQKIDTAMHIESLDYEEGAASVLILHTAANEAKSLSRVSIDDRQIECSFELRSHNEKDVLQSEISSIFLLNGETIILSGGKLFKCDVLRHNKKPTHSNRKLQEAKTSSENIDLKRLSLKEVILSNAFTIPEKLKRIRHEFSVNPDQLRSFNREILVLNLQAGLKNNPISIHLIDNSGDLHLEDLLMRMLKCGAYTEAVHVYYKMGSYIEAFDLCEQKQNIELMITTVKKCLVNDQESFHSLFERLMNYIKTKPCQFCEDDIVYIIERHPNSTECLDLLPMKWIRNPNIIRIINQAFDKYKLEVRLMIKAKQVQAKESHSQLEIHYECPNISKQMRISDRCGICGGDLFVRRDKEKVKDLIHFPSCQHVFHRNCLYNMTSGLKKEIQCTMCDKSAK